jgi:hypothetical protein
MTQPEETAPVFDETRREALERWFDCDEVLDRVRAWNEAERWLDLEEYVRQGRLIPLTLRQGLPDWLLTDEGLPLFTTEDLHPGTNHEGWAAAVDIGWEVIERRLGIERKTVHAHIDRIQEDDWERFMKSVEERKKQRGLS